MEDLRRELRRLTPRAATATVALAALGLTALKPADREVQSFERVEAERIDIVGADGDRSLVLSNRERFPNPVIGGEEFERSIQPSGLVLYDGDGNEMGGFAALDVEGRGRRAALIFDYRNSEAVGLSASGTADGERYSTGLTLADRIPLDADIREVGTTGTPRLELNNDDGNASVVLNDPEGNPRIRLFVDSAGEAGVEMLDPEGRVVERLGANGTE